MELFLLRHGRTYSNDEGRYRGWSEADLSMEGRRQAEKTADYLSRQELDRIFCSDLYRARETAQIVGEKCGLKPFPTPLIREMHFGRWEGLNYEEIMESGEKEFDSWISNPFSIPVPGGENLKDVYHRIRQFEESLHKAGLEGKSVAVVTHGGLIRTWLFYTMEMKEEDFWNIQIKNASISLLHKEEDSLQVVYYNYTDHLESM